MNARTYSVLRSRLARPLFLTVLFALLTAPLLLNGSAQAARAVIPGNQGKIAFSSDRDGNTEIYTMNPDGSGLVRLTYNDALDGAPDWAPDGKKIAFVSDRDGNREIYVMNADGSNQERLTSNAARDQSPAWSPDGTQIAFSTYRDGNGEVYVMNADGTAPTNLTNHPGEDSTPSWSPDGTQIVFGSYRDDNSEIYVMNADGSSQTNVTNSIAGEDYGPEWSQDGHQIVFVSDRDLSDEIYIMGTDGSNPTNLTIDPADDTEATWSPDGTQIAFRSNRDGSVDIYVMNSNGTGLTQLTDNDAFDMGPDWWAPDVKRLYINPNRRNAVLHGQSGPFVAQRQDIVVNELGTDIWALFFDGSIHGLNKSVTSLAFYDDGLCATGPALLMTFNGIQKLPGFEANPQDVAAFCPDVANEYNGTGTWTMFFDGSDVGLTSRGEIIDALEMRPDGRMIISTKGNFKVPAAVPPAVIQGRKNDLLLFTPVQYGPDTAGTWEMHLNHLLVQGLGRENIISSYQEGGDIYLSFWSRWTVGGLRGDRNDIVIVHDDYSVELFWDGEAYGYPYRVHGIHID